MDTREAYMGCILQNPEALHFPEIVHLRAQAIVHGGIRQRCHCEYAHQPTLAPLSSPAPDTRRMLDEYRYGPWCARKRLDTNDIAAPGFLRRKHVYPNTKVRPDSPLSPPSDPSVRASRRLAAAL
jgi:hypothetical protein